MTPDLKKYLAEAIATFTLVFIGAGSILSDTITNGKIGITGIAFAHGFAIMAMVYATAHISGAHINPAVTVAMWLTKKIDRMNAIFYIISQLIGASVAGFFLKFAFMLPGSTLGTPQLIENMTPFGGILVEAVLTFLLVFVVYGVAIDKKAPKEIFGLAIGMAVTFDVLAGGALTGAAMNPARAFGPALASGFWLNHLVYWIGPIAGAVAAAFFYTKIFLSSKG